jgi:hypothetical protein
MVSFPIPSASGAPAQPAMTVVIAGARIAAVAKNGSVPIAGVESLMGTNVWGQTKVHFRELLSYPRNHQRRLYQT